MLAEADAVRIKIQNSASSRLGFHLPIAAVPPSQGSPTSFSLTRGCVARCLSFFCETGRGERTKDLVRRLRSAPSPRSISGGIFHLVARLATARGEAPLLRSRRDRSLTPSPVLCSLNKPSRYPARSSRSLAMGRQIGGQKLPSQCCLSGAEKSDRVKHHPLQ